MPARLIIPALALSQAASAVAESGAALVPAELEVELEAVTGLENDLSDLAELTLRPTWENPSEDGLDYTLSLRMRVAAADDFTPGRPDRTGYASISRPVALGDAGEIELRDAYVDFELGDLDLRLGKQQIVWGKLYGFKLLDVVNPQSFRRFILDEFDESRIGLWTINARAPLPDIGLGDWTGQVIVSPDTTVHRLPNPGSTFDLTAPRFRFGLRPEDPVPDAIRTERPDNPIDDAVFGARLAGFVRGIDLSFVMVSGLDPQPLGRLETEGDTTTLVRFNKRRTLFGASAAGNVGRVVLRFEAGFTPNRSIQTRLGNGVLSDAQADQLGIAVAADFSGPFDTFMSFQVLQDMILTEVEGNVRPDNDTLISAFVRRSFIDDKLTASVQLLAADGLTNFVLRPRVTYEFDDTTRISLGADIFSGNSDEIFGQFADRDQITLGIIRTF
ncbi:MAG: DUF1302 family protein [Pseudomonadota bacterium]